MSAKNHVQKEPRKKTIDYKQGITTRRPTRWSWPGFRVYEGDDNEHTNLD
jgi:hypothetical protein